MSSLPRSRRARCFQTESLFGRRPRPALGDGAAERRRHHLPLPSTWPLPTSPRTERSAWPPAAAARCRHPRRISNPARRWAGLFIASSAIPALQVAAARYAGPEHQAVIALLRERLADPGFAPALGPRSGRSSSFSPQLRSTSSPATPPAGPSVARGKALPRVRRIATAKQRVPRPTQFCWSKLPLR